MNIRIITIISLGIISFFSPLALGFQQPKNAPLANYDIRSSTQAAADTGQEQATAALKARVPALKVERDKLLGVPRLISSSRGFLTGPSGRGKGVTDSQVDVLPANDPHRVIEAFVNEHSALFGHNATALAKADVSKDYVTKHNGLRTVIWQQKVDEVPVFEGVLMSHITSKGELISVSSRFVPDADKAAANGRPNHRAQVANPTISSARAILIAARNLGTDLDETSVSLSQGPDGSDKRQVFRGQGVHGDAYAQLRWLPWDRDSMRLCWRVDLKTRSHPEMYSVLVEAETGEVLVRRCLTAYIKSATYNVYTSDSPSPFSPGSATPNGFQPAIISRQQVSFGAISTNASPNGWINDADSETRGNNVDAHTDKDNDDNPDLPRPQGTGAGRVFDFPLTLSQSPSTYSSASVVNLFYWNNFMHDKLYELGFTEAAGNFQNSNFGKGGLGNDAVQADAQDGGGTDNANFSTLPDGFPGRMQMYIFTGPNPDRDGDLDAEVMCHEYTHGLSNRLVGGGVGISALQTGGMGEGWSDFYGLSLLSEDSDDVNGNYPFGAYVTYRLGGFPFADNYYFGIRRYPYSTDMTKNPLTFKDIDPKKASAHQGIPISSVSGGGNPSEVHNVGEVWCVTLWEARASLVEKFGFDIGNQLMLKLVTDGMKLCPPDPTFLEARDAIIQADQVDTGGDNFDELWIAFAKRGMGQSAIAPPSDTTTGVTEAFDLPEGVAITVPDGILDITLIPPANSALFAGSTQTVFLRVTDAGPINNATITADINGTNLVFKNDGVAPDVTASNAIYTASFLVPTNLTSLTLTYNITAPGKDPASGSANYSIIQIPANDNFTNAIKIPATGGFYVSNNRLATVENGEPNHGGVPATASLWWSYSTTNNGPVLLDTAGSTFNTIIAVYTNSTLATLAPVASADDFGTRNQAFLVLDAKANTTYRIAVASASANANGTIFFNVAPNGIADTNPPVVNVSSPTSGLTLNTNRVLVTGTVVEPNPVPSGINEITIRVNPGGTVETFRPPASIITSSNWSRQVGLSAGLNIIQVSASDIAGNKSTPVSFEVIYHAIDPANDLFANAIVLTTNTGVSTVNSINATKEFNEPNHAGNAGGKSVWWSFTAPADGLLALTTTNSTFDTLLAVYTGSSVSALTVKGFNDDAGLGGFSALSLAVNAGQNYHIAVDGFDGASGVVFLDYSFSTGAVYNFTISADTGGQVAPSSGSVVSNSTVTVMATPDSFYEFDSWTGAFSSTANPLSFVVNSNLSLTAHFHRISFTEDFETGGLLKLPWATSGNQPWTVQANTVLAGTYAARSGAIGNNQTSSLLLTTNFGGGFGSFYFKVSSEPNFDFLRFYVDGSLVQQWSGEVGWQNYPFNLTSGTHTLEWRYTKDPNGVSGLDAAFLDNINLPIRVPIDSSSAAHLQIVHQADGSLLIQILGQTNQEYITQRATNLLSPISWQNLSTNVATGGVIQFVDPNAGGNAVRFYRAVVQ